MTLLESIVAFVVLALVGIACLDLSRGALDLQRSTEQWTQAVTVAESALAAAAVDEAPSMATGMATGMAADMVDAGAPTDRASGAGLLRPQVTRRVWRDGVDVIEVTVPLPHGGAYAISRLVPRRQAAARLATGAITR